MKRRIHRYLAPLRRKMRLQKILELGMLHLAIFGALSLAILACTKLFFLPRYMELIKGLAGLSASAFLVHSLLRLPRRREAVREADALYFQERLVTSLEFEEEQGLAIEEQREDTLKKMAEIRVERLYKFRFPKRLAAILGVLLACHFGLFFLETESARKNAEALQEQREVEKRLEELKEKLKESLAEQTSDRELEKKILESLEDKLRGIGSREEALKALSMAKNEISEMLSEQERKELEESLKQIDEAARSLAGETLSDYAFQDEEEASEGGKGDAEAPEGGQDPSEAPEDKEAAEGAAGGGADRGAGEKPSGEGSSGGGAESGGEGNSGGESDASDSDGASGDPSGESEGTPGAPGEKGEGKSQSGEGGAQAGGANGESGENTGQPGGQQGGQKNPGGGKSGNGAGAGGKGRGRGAGSNETMLDPKRLLSEEKRLFVPSQKSGEESSYQRAKTLPKDLGEVKDYKKLFAEYAREADYTGKELKIPSGMSGLVKSYFDSIQK